MRAGRLPVEPPVDAEIGDHARTGKVMTRCSRCRPVYRFSEGTEPDQLTGGIPIHPDVREERNRVGRATGPGLGLNPLRDLTFPDGVAAIERGHVR